MSKNGPVALDRCDIVGPDPTWEALTDSERRSWLDDIADFPPPPLLLELLSMDLRFDAYNPKQLAERLSKDAVLTGRILGRANSAAVSPVEPIDSLPQAMVHLGFNMVRSTIVRYQVEVSAQKLKGIVRENIMKIHRSTDNGAIIAYNWAKAANHKDPAKIATRCLLGRLGTFLIVRRFPELIDGYFASGHEPQRLNYEANQFKITTRNLTYKVAQAWKLPEEMQVNLYNLWNPLFAESDNLGQNIACAAMSLSFDPPNEMDDISKWLSLRVHHRLKDNLEACGALAKLPSVLDSEAYLKEMAIVSEA